MSRATGTIPTRFPSRQHAATNPAAFEFDADVEVEPAQPTTEAQALRNARWFGFIDVLTNKEAVCG